MSHSHSRSGTKSNAKNQKMSTKVVLGRSGLVEYFQFFERAGYQMLDGNAHPSDFQVEAILAGVERHCCVEFEADIRVKLWKALRYQWFRGPGHGQDFIERNQVPDIALPKKDYKQIDWMVKFADVDPDRQRQIIRKTRPCESTGRGPGVQTLQFEVYRRQKDIWYEFKDLQRCVTEWQRKNPRTMLREDPREEVLKIRVRNIMDLSSAQLTARRGVGARQRNIGYILLVIQIINAIMFGLMCFTAFYRYRNTPRQIIFSFIVSSQQFVSGIAYLMALMVAYAVSIRRHADAMETRFQKLIYSCERLTEQISDFRVETEDIRLLKAEAPTAELVKAGAPPPKEVREKPKKRRKPKDKGLAMWAPDYGKQDPEEQQMLIQKAIEESYKILEPLSDNFKPNGGDRMVQHMQRLGGIDEGAIVHVLKGRGEDKLGGAAYEVEYRLSHPDSGPLMLQGDPFQLPALPGPKGDEIELPELLELHAGLPQLPMLPPQIPLLPPPLNIVCEAEDPPTARADFTPVARGNNMTPLGVDNMTPLAGGDMTTDSWTPATPQGELEDTQGPDPDDPGLHHWMPGFVASPERVSADGSQTPPQTPPLRGHHT